MKIAYVTTYDSSEIQAWSGLGNYILRTLQGAGFETETVGNLRERRTSLWLSKLKRRYYAELRSKKYLMNREPAILRDYSAHVEKILGSMDYDIVFSPGTIPIAYLQTQKPIAFWTDATFAGMVDFYPNFTNLCPATIRNGNKMEQLALSKCHLAIYASEWAASTAIKHYEVDPAKVKTVPFGANIECDRNQGDIEKIVENKTFDICKLLFLGVDWHRKGGEKALAVASLLNQRGVRTELHIAGCDPPSSLPGFAKRHGFISKKTDAGSKYLENLISESHFLIVPSRAECYGVVFAEASSFGLPSLATKVGGIPTVVHDGRNGWTFALDERPETYCDYIEKLMFSREGYRELALSSFREYSEKLNWLSAGRQVHALIQECVANKATSLHG